MGVHGLRGRLKILPLTDYPERFESMETLEVYGQDGVNTATLTPVSFKWMEGKNIIVLEAEEVQGRETAEPLVGRNIEVAPEERYPLEDGAYWVDDLMGLTVREAHEGTALGTISGVIPGGEHDLYAVTDFEGKVHYIPAVKEFISAVDLDKREMRVILIEGLWEL